MCDTAGGLDSATAARVAKLERQAVRLRIGVLGALIFAVVALYQAIKISGRLDAQAQSLALAIAAKDGRVTLLGVQPDGSTGLVLSDAKGKLRASLLVRPDGGPPRLDLFDADGNRRVLVGLTKEGAPVIETLDAAGKPAKPGP